VSAETKAVLEAAIAAHIADECDGDIAQGYVLVTETTSFEDMDHGISSWRIDTREHQSKFTTDGLLWNALHVNADPADD